MKISKMYPPETLVLTSAISEVFLRRLAKQGYIRYHEGQDFLETRQDLLDDGDPDGGGLKELDEKLSTRLDNLKDMVLYRFNGTGVVQVLTRASELLGLVPVFPVRSVGFLREGVGGSEKVFRDCVLVKRGSTVSDVAKKVMGDVPIAYIETVGGVRVSEDDLVRVGKNDVSTVFLTPCVGFTECADVVQILSFKVGRA
jgi:ribosome-binding ATPase YchF (GTP1/OBG family)